jgi:hypothetical protein
MRLRVQGQREVGIGFDLDNLAVATAEGAEPIIVLYRANTRARMLHESTDAMRDTDTTRGYQPLCARGGIVVANLVRLLGSRQIVTFTDL